MCCFWKIYKKWWKCIYIASISEEGRILIWNPEHKLKNLIKGYNLGHKIERNIIQINSIAFIDNPFESFDFRFGK